MKINRHMTNICTDNLIASKQFYTQYFDFEVQFDSDWFIQLKSNNIDLEIGLIDKHNALVPTEFQNTPTGFYQTYVVDNVDNFAAQLAANVTIIQPPEDTQYGQRRILIKAPEGSLIDISSLME
ncbi:MAG: hypothetical protein COC24_000830 [Alphaproteobacteria bacterium]|nr:hypothetical protein [Alphaproteobacteria bacterium]